MSHSKQISFDMIRQSDMQVEEYEDYYEVEQSFEGQGVNIHGNNNTININFGDIKRKNSATPKEYYETEYLCANEEYGTGEFCESICEFCAEQGARYDQSSIWWYLPIPLQILTLPLVLPFVGMGAMHRGSNQLITETQIEYKEDEKTVPKERTHLYEDESTSEIENYELSESEIAFIDRLAEISGEEPVYTRENYIDIMYSKTVEEPTAPSLVEDTEKITDIQKQFNEYLKKAS